MKIDIKPVTYKDFFDICLIQLEIYDKDEYDDEDCGYCSDIKSFIRNIGNKSLCVKKGKYIIGFILLDSEVKKDKRILYIDDIAVKPQYRDKGIAKKLIKKVIEDYDYHEITCHHRVSNTPAISLTMSLGFKVKELIKDYYEDYYKDGILIREDAYLMVKER